MTTTTSTSTPAQRSAIAALCARLGIDADTKQELVSQYSNGRTTSSKELTIQEAAALLAAIAKPTPGPVGVVGGAATTHTHDAAARMRRQIIAIFHEAGWHLESQRPLSGDVARKIDMQRVNAWCIQHGYLHKKLNAYTYEELPKLVTQAKKYLEWYLKKI